MSLRSFALAIPLLASLAACTAAGDGADGTAAPAGGARFFLPTQTPTNTSAPALAVDAKGGTHAVYPAYVIGDAFYAYCGPGCTSADDVRVVRFPTDGTTHNAMLALTADGKPRVVLTTSTKVYYASCDADCGAEASWKLSTIMTHDGNRTSSGEAFALDPSGRPRFLMHVSVAVLGIGQKPPETFLVQCDSGCDGADRWTSSMIAEEIWQGSQLRIAADGTMKVATVVTQKPGGQKENTAAYLDCASDCTKNESWKGIGFGPSYQNDLAAVAIKPRVSMALTKNGSPRVAFIGTTTDTSERALMYFACDQGCREDRWTATMLTKGEEISDGVDVALDAQDRPRVAFALSYNIGLASCDAGCTDKGTSWHVAKVELGSDMKKDEIIPYPNCDVAAWFLHAPSLALTPSGEPRVGYQSRDISGGWKNADKTASKCVAGTDMTFARLAMLPSVQ